MCKKCKELETANALLIERIDKLTDRTTTEQLSVALKKIFALVSPGRSQLEWEIFKICNSQLKISKTRK
jgi:hypothetical protein